MRDKAIEIARGAGAILRQGLQVQRSIERKSASIDVVTDIDLASERFIVDALQAHFPDHRIITEEAGDGAQNSTYCWVIDPLDGTTNYAHGFPMFCVSIALLIDNVPGLGVVYDPMRDECFVAERGQGAVVNDQPLQVSSIAELEEALVSTGFPYTRRTDPDNNLDEMRRVTLEVMGIRRAGSAALDLCYVAAGRLDGHWELGLKPWDTAAGALLVEEAGGVLSSWEGAAWNPFMPRLVATNGHIHQALLNLLQRPTH